MHWGDGFTEFEQLYLILPCQAYCDWSSGRVKHNKLTNGAAQACDEKDDLTFGIKYW